MAWMQGGFSSMAAGGNFWEGAGKGLLSGTINAGLSMIGVPGMITNGLLTAGTNVLGNGISNLIYGDDFFDNWAFAAGSGFATGAWSGYNMAKSDQIFNRNIWTGKITGVKHQPLLLSLPALEPPTLLTDNMLSEPNIRTGNPTIEVGELRSNATSYMDVAMGYYGLNETDNSNAIYNLFQRPLGLNNTDPWCSAYANRVFSDVGIQGTGYGMARSWLNWGTPGGNTAQYGQLAIFSRGTNPMHGHVGFVIGSQGNNLLILGGNQSNSVRISLYPISRLLSLRWF